MKKIIMGMILGSTAISSWAACNYDLNGTNAGTLAFPSVVNQKATYSIAATTTQLDYSAINSNFDPNATTITGDIQFVSNGIIAFELDTTVIPNDLPGTEGVMQSYVLMGLDANNKQHGLSIAYSNNTSVQNYKRAILIMQTGPNGSGNPTVLSVDVKPYSASTNQNIGVYINQNSNQYGLIINGVNQGYVGNFSSQIKKAIYQIGAATYKVPTSSTNIGKPLSMELITDHSKMKNAYPTGTTDICGNAI
jgi:hypothetical protein